jgi:hypothetical protein
LSWDAEDNDLGYTMMRLRNDVDDLVEVIEHLPGRLSELDGSLDDVRRGLQRIDARSVEVESSSRELLAQVKRLGARVEWLERNIRLTSTTAEAELDDVDAAEEQLAIVAERGAQARAGLLPPSGRSALEATIGAHADAVRARERHRELALAACDVLAGTRWDDERHAGAVAEFQAAVAAMDLAREQVRELAGPADEAADQLSSDEGRQLAVADVIADGDLAWAALHERLRVRVADAVGLGALLPTWFTTVLGPIPPAEDTRAWMDVATSLLAYRVTYAVTDPIVALGREPGSAETARRRAWYQQLRRQLGDLQR